MECPNCGVYNPDDRKVCWRCDRPLPTPPPEKRRSRQTSQLWLYIALAAAIVIPLLRYCGNALPQPGQ